MPERKIAAMHKEYGKAHGYKCEGCPASDATDWARSWPACGLYGQPVDKDRTPLLERLKHAKRPDSTPIPGQIDMFGGVE